MEELDQLIEQYRSLKLAKRHLVNLKARLVEERTRLEALTFALNDQYKDVLDFQEASVRGLFHRILGDHEEQYELERQEYLMLALQYNESEKALDLLEFERRVLEEKLLTEETLLARLGEWMKLREEAIAQKYPDISTELMEMNRKLDFEIGFGQELRELLIVALQVRNEFEKMIKLLAAVSKVKDWKKSGISTEQDAHEAATYLDQALLLSYIVKQKLQELEDELEDIYEYRSVKRMVRLDEFKYFNDIYYDRLISDWITSGKIYNALNYLIGKKNSMQRMVDTLKNEQKKTEKKIEELNAQKQQLILDRFGN